MKKMILRKRIFGISKEVKGGIIMNNTRALKPLIIPGSQQWNRIHSNRLKKHREVRKAKEEFKRNTYVLISLVVFIYIYGNIAARLI